MKRTFWQKIYQDLRQNAFRVILAVVSVVVATAALSSISSSFTILRREMTRDFMDTNPFSALLVVIPNDSLDLQQAVLRSPSVGEAEWGQTLEGRVEVSPNVWKKMHLFVVPDFNEKRINKIGIEQGQLPQQAGDVLIERSCLSVITTGIGKSLAVTVENGKKASLKVSGIAHDPAQPPGWMHGEVYAYTRAESLPILGLPLAENSLKLTFNDKTLSQNETRQVVLNLRKQLEQQGFRVIRTLVPPPATHPHDRQLKAILSILLVFSIITLVLASVVIANLMNGFLTRQIKQIGIMKAIGGTTPQLTRLYAGFIASMVLLGVSIGWTLHFPMARYFTNFVANQLNFNILDPNASGWLYLLQISICILIPFVFGLLPVYQTLRKSVLSALNHTGLQENYRSQIKWKVRFISRPALLTLRNTFRQKRRFWLTMTSLALGGAAFMASLNLQKAWQHTIDQVAANQRFDVDIKLFTPLSIPSFDSLAKSDTGIRNYEAWSAEKTFVKYPDHTESLRFELVGIPANTTFQIPAVQEGVQLYTKPAENEMLVNRSLAFLEPNLKVGNRYTLYVKGKTIVFRLAGIIYEADAEPAFYTYKTNIDTVMGQSNSATFFRLNFDRNHVAEPILSKIEAGLAARNASVEAVKQAHELEQNFADHFTIIINMLLVIAFFLASVGFMGLSSTLSMNVLERMKEFGIMQAIGASGTQITKMIVWEGLLISVLSWGLACVVALPVSWAMGNAIGKVGLLKPLDFVVSWQAVGAWLGLVSLFSLLVGLVPSYQAKRIAVREVLGYE